MAIDCQAKFSSNSNQTHLKQLIKVFRITWKLKAGVFDYSWSWTLQDSRWPGAGLGTPVLKQYQLIAKWKGHFAFVCQPWSTTWLLGSRICCPSAVWAYCRIVGWLGFELVMVRVCRPCTPSEPELASCREPLDENVTAKEKTKLWWTFYGIILCNSLLKRCSSSCCKIRKIKLRSNLLHFCCKIHRKLPHDAFSTSQNTLYSNNMLAWLTILASACLVDLGREWDACYGRGGGVFLFSLILCRYFLSW